MEKASQVDERGKQGWAVEDEREQGRGDGAEVSRRRFRADDSFDAKHPSLQTHAPFLTIAQDDLKAAKRAAREAAAVDGPAQGKGKAKELTIEELWRPGAAAVSFWEAAGIE